MKITRILVLALLVLSLPSAFAAEKKKRGVEEKPVPAAPASSYGSDSQSAVTGSIGAVDGNFVFGPGFQMEWPVTLEGHAFAAGWQTGLYYTSTSSDALGVRTSAKTWGIPLMASGKYLIPNGISFLKPYLALAFGLSVDRSSTETNVTGTNVKKTDTDVHFALFFRPGVTFGESQSWFAELPIGVLFTGFAILPTIGYRF